MDIEKISLIKNLLEIQGGHSFAVLQCALLIEERLRRFFDAIRGDSTHPFYHGVDSGINNIYNHYKKPPERFTMGEVKDVLKNAGFFNNTPTIKKEIDSIVKLRNEVAHGRKIIATDFDKIWQFFQEFIKTFDIGDFTQIEWTVSYRNQLQMLFAGQVEELTETLLSSPAEEKDIHRFYAGAPLDWDIIAANADIERDLQAELLKALRKPSTGLRVVTIVAEPGAGKSTLAWRLAAELFYQRAIVLRVINSDNPEIWYQLSHFYDILRKPFYVLVDDAFRSDDVFSALQGLSRALPVTLVATSRHNEYRTQRLKGEIESFRLAPPSQREKERLLARLGKSVLTVEQRQRLDKADVFLVLMMELTAGKGFNEIIQDTLDRLKKQDDTLYRAYEYICLAYSENVVIPVSLLERLDENFYNLIEQEPLQGLVFCRDGKSERYIRAGHPVIAKASDALYAKRTSPVKRLREIIQKIDIEDDFQRSFISHLLRAFAQTRLSTVQPVMIQEEAIITACQQRGTISDFFSWQKIYRLLGQKTQVQRCVESALQLKPTRSIECNLLLVLYRNCQREKEALLVFNQWIKQCPEFPDCRVTYLGLIERYGSLEQITTALQQTTEWLAQHLEDTHVRNAYLGLVERKGTNQQVATALQQTTAWLAQHLEDTHVRNAYLGLVERKGTNQQVATALQQTTEWLTQHPEDANVRTAYLGLVERKGTNQQVATALQETTEWLAQHLEDINVRERYLGLVERKGMSQQVAIALQQTTEWLAQHPEDANVRAAYLGLVERNGTSQQVTTALQETTEWLAQHLEDTHVRERYLGLVERKGTSQQVATVLQQTTEWLAQHLEDTHVRERYLGLVERKGTSEQLTQALQETDVWLEKHPHNEGVLLVYTSILAKQPHITEQDNHALALCKALLNKQPKNFIRHTYASLLLKIQQFAEAADHFRQVLEQHKGHAMARNGLAQALRGLANLAQQAGDKTTAKHYFEEAESELRQIIYWAKKTKGTTALFYTHLGWLYLDQHRYQQALQTFDAVIRENPQEHFVNYWGKGKALMGLGKLKEAKLALQTALDKAPENLQPPASQEIPELLAQCQ